MAVVDRLCQRLRTLREAAPSPTTFLERGHYASYASSRHAIRWMRRLVCAAAGRSLAQTVTAAPPSSIGGGPTYPFFVPPLPYAVSANEPYIDAQTMELHHDKHHAAYVGNLNAAVKDHSQVAGMPLLAMLAKLDELPEAIRTTVRNNGGGHANHSMFWEVMGGRGGEPTEELTKVCS